MRITGITVSVGYADKLALGLDVWRETLDDLYVVTSGRDKETADLCRGKDRMHQVWSDPHKDGAHFNKASMLNAGISHMYTMRDRQGSASFVDWILAFDADVVPPSYWRGYGQGVTAWQLEAVAREGNIYGAKRVIADPHTVTGFFMLWHDRDPRWTACPNFGSWDNASGYDTEFMERWPESMRFRLPLTLTHYGMAGESWLGREAGAAGVAALQAKRLAEGPESWRKERIK